MYCKQKSNGNFRVYKAGDSRHPIGYLKKGPNGYRAYAGRTYCAKISIRRRGKKITTKMVIAGHEEIGFASSRGAYKKTPKEFRVDCIQPCRLFQAFCFAVFC